MKRFGTHGMTLPELAISVTIAIALSVVAYVGYTSYTKGSRDAKRIENIKTLEKTIVFHQLDRGVYPSAGTTVDKALNVSSAIAFYNSGVSPTDPKSGQGCWGAGSVCNYVYGVITMNNVEFSGYELSTAFEKWANITTQSETDGGGDALRLELGNNLNVDTSFFVDGNLSTPYTELTHMGAVALGSATTSIGTGSSSANSYTSGGGSGECAGNPENIGCSCFDAPLSTECLCDLYGEGDPRCDCASTPPPLPPQCFDCTTNPYETGCPCNGGTDAENTYACICARFGINSTECTCARNPDNPSCAVCGNNLCENGENFSLCSDDCQTCGDGICDDPQDTQDDGEDANTCGGAAGDCGCDEDNVCEAERREVDGVCASDCGCNNNGTCEAGRWENPVTCMVDCHCGDNICQSDSSEYSGTCTDCECGDGLCYSADSEDADTCPADCAT